jgi:hypothetical protein
MINLHELEEEGQIPLSSRRQDRAVMTRLAAAAE